MDNRFILPPPLIPTWKKIWLWLVPPFPLHIHKCNSADFFPLMGRERSTKRVPVDWWSKKDARNMIMMAISLTGYITMILPITLLPERIIRLMLILLHVKHSYVYPRPIYGQTVQSGKSKSLFDKPLFVQLLIWLDKTYCACHVC